jgi:hypothetical protein
MSYSKQFLTGSLQVSHTENNWQGALSFNYQFTPNLSISANTTKSSSTHKKNGSLGVSINKLIVLSHPFESMRGTDISNDWMYGHVYIKNLDTGKLSPLTGGIIRSSDQAVEIRKNGYYFINNISTYPNEAVIDYSNISVNPEYSPNVTEDRFYVDSGQGIHKNIILTRNVGFTGQVYFSNIDWLKDVDIQIWSDGKLLKSIRLNPMYQGNFFIKNIPYRSSYRLRAVYTGKDAVKIQKNNIKIETNKQFYIILPNLVLEKKGA